MTIERTWMGGYRVLIYRKGEFRAAVYRHFLAGWHCQTLNPDNPRSTHSVRKYGSRNGAMNAARRHMGLRVKRNTT